MWKKIKRSVRIIKDHIFKVDRLYMLKKDLDPFKKTESLRGVQDMVVRRVDSPMELDALVNEGYDIKLCPFLEMAHKNLERGAGIFFALSGKTIIHATWVFLDTDVPPFDEVFIKYPFENAGYIGPCVTKPEFRGRGIYSYMLNQACEFFKTKGKTQAMINTNMKNLSSLRGITKAGFRKINRVTFIKFLRRKYIILNKLKDAYAN